LPRRVVYTKDGTILHLLVTTGRGREFLDFVGHGTKDFGSYVRGRHLLIKGAPADVRKLYDVIRDIGARRFGLLPIAMPPTAVSRVCDFVWDDSRITVSEDEFADALASELSGHDIAPAIEPSAPPPEARPRPIAADNRIRCGTCGRPEVGAEVFATCSFCGKPFCFGDMGEHEPRCPKRGEKIKSLDGSELYCSDCEEKTPHWAASNMSLRCGKCGHVYTEVSSAR
jgi:hypothetical protein